MHIAPIQLGQLHDSTLRSVHLDWSTGEVRMALSAVLAGSSASRVVLQASEVTLLRCPRLAPWGWSVSVNEVRRSTDRDGRVRLELEMQSGDVIEIEGKAMTVEVAA